MAGVSHKMTTTQNNKISYWSIYKTLVWYAATSIQLYALFFLVSLSFTEYKNRLYFRLSILYIDFFLLLYTDLIRKRVVAFPFNNSILIDFDISLYGLLIACHNLGAHPSYIKHIKSGIHICTRTVW